MAVRAAVWRRCAVPLERPRRDVPWIVPVIALLVAALPAWLGIDVGLPRPLARDFQVVVVSEQPKPVAPPTDDVSLGSMVALPLPVEDGPVLGPVVPPPAVEKPRSRPSLAVVGVGLQGLVMRSEPGGGERLQLVPEGMDLRDLGEEREAGGRDWRKVAHPDGAIGWVASDFLVQWDGLDREARTRALLKRSAGLESTETLDRAWMQAPPDLRSITPDQLKDGQTLSSWEGYAACGPAAAVAFARAIGHDLTLDQSVNAARQVGWTALLGIQAHQRGESEDEIDWERVIGDVQAGIPVMIVTAQHYYVAEGYDPSTGKLDFGNSALVLAGARHQRWFTPAELDWLGYGSPFTTIHLGPAAQPSEYLRATNVAY
jgi:hypothetical protein